tara:strand:+ start:235 stop:393 length:159 start_codon:yes stop_codon:yes gene_type:complete
VASTALENRKRVVSGAVDTPVTKNGGTAEWIMDESMSKATLLLNLIKDYLVL